MTASQKKSVLFLEDKLDLSHLKVLLEKYELDSHFIARRASFFEECKKKKYDLLVISDIDEYRHSIVDSLDISINSDTPVLLIMDNNLFPDVDELLKQDINIITFPFTPQEFVYRTYRILKALDTDTSIHNSLKSFKKLFDLLPVGLIQTDEYGKFLRLNPKFQSIISMQENELMKENFFQLCHPDDYFLERKQLDRLLRKELNSVDYEIRLINNEGKTIVCKIQATVLWNGKDVFDSFIFVIQLVS